MAKPGYQYYQQQAKLIKVVPELRAWEGTLGYYRRFLSSEVRDEVAHQLAEWVVANPALRVPVHELIAVLEIIVRDTLNQRDQGLRRH